MATTRAADTVLSLCHKATVLGNKIAIHMLEYLGTVEKHSSQFDDLALEFMDTSRIMWALEAGLTECTKNGQRLPGEMLSELEKKFRTTHTDFQVLDQILSRFLDYEKKGTVGRLQKGFRSMFSSNDVQKMRDNLEKTREALRMSALVFQWSLGDDKIDESVGIGYTGLAAALERLTKVKTGLNSSAGTVREKTYDINHHVHEVPPDPLPPLPALPALSGIGNSRGGSNTDRSSGPTREDAASPVFKQAPEREPSISGYTIKTSSSRSIHEERRMSVADNFDRAMEGFSNHRTGTGNGSGNGSGPADHSNNRSNTSGSLHHSGSVHHSDSARHTEADTLIDEMEAFEPFKVVRFKADPHSQPRWQPRNSSGADSHDLRQSLVSAVDARNSKMVEQLLDRGVNPNLGPNAHILNQAISHHDTETVRVLLLFGADVNAPDNQDVNPLYMAAETSSLEAATLLLKYGADPNSAVGRHAETPLSNAVLDDKFNLARALLAYGGDANHVMADGDTLLMAAIKRKRSKRVIDLLLDYGADANTKNGHGHTPLFEAIGSHRIEIVATLLDHRANVNLPGPKHMLWPAASLPRILELLLARGADPKRAPGVMELATSENNIDSVRVLLKANVDPNARKDGIYTPLCSAIRDDRADIFDLLLANGADPNAPSAEYPAFKCVTHYRTQYLAPLVEAGADLNTPKGILEMAVQCHNLEALNWLLDSGKVSPNDKAPKTGCTPLTTAIRENRPDLVELLLSRGADPNIRGENWPVCMAVKQPAILKRLLPALAEPRAFKGVMEMAVVANQIESIKLLLKAGVSVEDRNGGVFSPLTTAIREERKEIVHFLLEEAGADVNAPGEHLPIVKALRRLHGADTEIVELLLQHGADPNRMYRGHNGFFQAVENGDPAILRLLMARCGVDLDARDDAGLTVVEVAASRGWQEGRAILLQGPKGPPAAGAGGPGAGIGGTRASMVR